MKRVVLKYSGSSKHNCNMKRVLVFAAFAAILAGCAKEIDNQIVESPETESNNAVKVVLHASIPEIDTKVSTDNAGAYKWQAGDVVTVLNTDGDRFEFDTEEGGTAVDFASSTFTGTLSTEAFYPATDNHRTEKFYLEPSIDWSADSSLMPMLGTVNTSELSARFQSVGSVIKLICYNVDKDADKLVVTSDSKQIVGQFTPSGSPKVITASASDENKVLTINFATAGAARNMVFYIPLPTGNVGTLTFEIKAGSTVQFSKTTKTSVSLGRNTVVVPSALDCAAIADALLTNEEIVSSVLSSYGSGTISSTSGSWAFSKAMKQTTSGITRMQIAASEYLKLPSFPNNVASIVLHSTGNGGGSGFSGTVYFSESSDDKDAIVSKAHSGALGTDITIDVPTGYKTGYLIPSGAFRVASITVKFERVGSVPSLTPTDDELTIAVGSVSASTTITYANKVDNLEIAVSSSAAWLTPAISGSYPTYTLSATASGANNNATDRSATITLKASGVKKTIDVTQATCLVPNPTVSAVAGDAKFTATWAGNSHATSYVAYLHTSPTATPATGGTDISASINDDGAGNYDITDYAVTNDTHYYLYIKVGSVAANYEAPSSYVESDFTPEEAKGTVTNPYTVAEALTVIDGYAPGSGGASSVYTEGIVVSVSSISSGKLTYFISDDGTSTNQLKVYYGKGLSNADFSATTDLEQGDYVVIYGQLYNYGGTPEINTGNYLTTLTKVHKLVLDPNTDILMGGAANSVYTMTITANYAWTATLNAEATTARGTNFDVLNSSDVVIDGTISGPAGTTTIKFKAKGDGNGDGSTITNYGTITFSDGTESSTKNIKQSPKVGLPDPETITFSTFGWENASSPSSASGDNCELTISGAKYYTSGTALRFYKTNTLRITSDYKIGSITFTYKVNQSSGKYPDSFNANNGSFSIAYSGSQTSVGTMVWGNASGSKDITFTTGSGSGNIAISSMEITYVN